MKHMTLALTSSSLYCFPNLFMLTIFKCAFITSWQVNVLGAWEGLRVDSKNKNDAWTQFQLGVFVIWCETILFMQKG